MRKRTHATSCNSRMKHRRNLTRPGPKKLLGITLGIMTALGGFVDLGQIVFTMQHGKTSLPRNACAECKSHKRHPPAGWSELGSRSGRCMLFRRIGRVPGSARFQGRALALEKESSFQCLEAKIASSLDEGIGLRLCRNQ